MLIIKEGIYPSDTGWSFPDDKGGMIHGTSYQDVAAQLAEFRTRNKLPEGEPLREVIEYLCAKNGSLCKHRREGPPVSVPSVPDSQATPKFDDRVLQWCASWLEGFHGRINPDEIRRRANKCKACPHNKAYNPSCGPCKRRLRRALDAVIGGFPRDAMKGLGGCSHYFWENRLACGSDICSDAGAPPECWRHP